MRRGWRFALAALAAAAFASDAAAAPLRVMSINLCTDQLALALLAPARITSVTWLARDPDESVMAAAAQRVPINDAQAEEVLRDRPDLVLAGPYTDPALRGLLQRLRIRVVETPDVVSFAEIAAVTRQVGDAVGARGRAEALIARMNAALAALQAQPPRWRPRVVQWDGGGTALGAGTLFDAVLEAAGARNVAAEAGLSDFGAFGIEQLLAARPDALIEDDPRFRTHDRRAEAAEHPVVRALYAQRRVVLPQAAYTCGTPFTAQAAIDLRAALQRLAPSP